MRPVREHVFLLLARQGVDKLGCPAVACRLRPAPNAKRRVEANSPIVNINIYLVSSSGRAVLPRYTAPSELLLRYTQLYLIRISLSCVEYSSM